jgi:hypothetical protein
MSDFWLSRRRFVGAGAAVIAAAALAQCLPVTKPKPTVLAGGYRSGYLKGYRG